VSSPQLITVQSIDITFLHHGSNHRPQPDEADNAKWFKCTYENAEKKDGSCLIEYIEEVCADPEAWVRSLPTNIKSFTLTKPKTANVTHSSRDPLEEQLKTDLKMNLERLTRTSRL
jgi:hypothetical protein